MLRMEQTAPSPGPLAPGDAHLERQFLISRGSRTHEPTAGSKARFHPFADIGRWQSSPLVEQVSFPALFSEPRKALLEPSPIQSQHE